MRPEVLKLLTTEVLVQIPVRLGTVEVPQFFTIRSQ